MARHFSYLLGLFLLLSVATAVAQPTYTIESKTAQSQGTVSVNVTVTNFTNVLGEQFNITWDANILKLATITNCAAVPGFICGLSAGSTITNFNQFQPGVLLHSWDGRTTATLADNTVLFTMNFNVVGGAGTSSAVAFSNDINPIEIIVKNGTKDNVYNSPNVSMKSGSVQVANSGTGGGTTGLKANLSSVTGGKGDKVCVDITMDNFKDIVGAQFLVTWDKTKLEFVSAEPDAVNLVGAVANGQAAQIIYVWSDQGLVPQTLANGAKILTACFKILIDGDGQTKIPVNITGTNLKPIEFGKLDGTSVPYTIGNGNITVKSNATPAIAISSVQTKNIGCKGGTDGTITYTIAGGDGTFAYKWSDAVATQNRTALAAGKYTLTVTSGNATTVSDFNITEPALALAATPKATDAICTSATGTAEVTVAGGTSGYTYAWAGSAVTAAKLDNVKAGSYLVTVTDVNKCTSIATVTVGTNNQTVTGAVTVKNTACTASIGTADATNIAGGTAPYTYLWSANASNATVPAIGNLKAGTYSVVITDKNGCAATFSQEVKTDNPTVTATVTPKNTVCTANIGTVEATNPAGGTAPYTYLWSVNNATTSVVSNLKSGNYTVTITDKNGCNAAFTQEIKTENPIVVAGLSVKDPICAGQDGSAVFAPTGGSAPYSLTWAFLPNAPTQVLTATGLKPGDYTVTVSDKNGCMTNQTVKINTPPAALAATFTSVKALCTSASGSAEATVSGGVAPYIYAWSATGSTATKIENVKPATYTLSVTDKNNCVSTFSAVIDQNTVNPLKIDLAKATDATCAGGTGAIDISPNSGKLPYTYNWDNNASASEDLSIASVGKHVVSVTDGNGCVQSGSYEIKAPEQVLVTAAPTNTKCAESKDGAAKVTNSTSGNAGAFTYAWSHGVAGSEVSGLAPGKYKVVATDSKGCKGESQEITINAPTAIQIAGTVADQTIPGTSGNGGIALTVNGGTGAYAYKWTSSAAKDLSGVVAGDYTVTVSDANNCQLTKAFTIKTNFVRFDEAKLVQADSRCKLEGSGEINAAVIGGTADYSYAWSVAGLSGSNPKNLRSGTYVVTVTDKNAVSITKSFTIKSLSSLSIKATNQGDAAPNQANGKSTAEVTGGTAPYNFKWSANGVVSQTNDILPNGRHTVTVTDGQGCTDTASVAIRTKSILSATVTATGGINIIPCPDRATGSANAIVTGNTGTVKYTWSNGSNLAQINNLAAGTYTVTASDETGVSVTASVTLKKPDDFDIKTSGIDFECDKGGIAQVVSITGGTAPYKYEWNDIAKSATQKLSNLKAGSYAVVITDANGCQQLRQVTVKDNCVPTGCYEGVPVMTPNDDGANEVFAIKCLERITKQKTLEIFNRWGQSVFRSESYDNEWNGKTVRGKDLPDGNYFYVFEFINPDTNQLEIKQGSFTMLRE
jgi:large repetitive protein